MLNTALKAGVAIDVYWGLSIGEICAVIRAFNERWDMERKETIVLQHRLADLIGASVARIFSSQATYPSLYDAYPNVFDEQEQNEVRQDWHVTKERLMDFAIAHNLKRAKQRKEEVDDSCQKNN